MDLTGLPQPGSQPVMLSNQSAGVFRIVTPHLAHTGWVFVFPDEVAVHFYSEDHSFYLVSPRTAERSGRSVSTPALTFT